MDEDFDIDATLNEVAAGLGEAQDEETPPGVSTQPAAASPEAPAEAPGFPKSWRQELAQHWGTLPRPVQEEVLRREGDILKGINTYKPGYEHWSKLAPVFEPYQQIMQQHGLTPDVVVRPLLQAHHDLSLGDKAFKEARFREIAKAYGLDYLFGQAQGQQNEQPWIDPTVQDLQSKVTQIGGTVQQFLQAAQEMQMKDLGSQVDAFAKDKPYFSDVAEKLPNLIRAGMSLEEAYDAAVWGTPALREKLLLDKAKAEQETSTNAKKEALTRARRASQPNVRPAGVSAQPTAPAGTMDETMAEAFREIRNRS